MPSLHVAYSTLVAGVVFPLAGKLRLATLALACSMAFSAVYLRHHYLLDVIAGVALALPITWLMKMFGPRAAKALEDAALGERRSLGGDP
jgi:membrane-associated phospholipid phosphatase